jgi:hypothetical protein
MVLTNCSKCEYLDRNPHHSTDIICSLNPAYASMWTRLIGTDDYTLSILPIDECRDFELDSALEEKEIPLSLTYSQWQQLTREPSYPDITKAYIIQALANLNISVALTLPLEQWQIIVNSDSIPSPLLLQLEQEGILPHKDPWVHVDSSCIDAIAFDRSSSILKIRFNSGDIYQYSDFSHDHYIDFCHSDSKGRFFNQVIKEQFDFVRL